MALFVPLNVSTILDWFYREFQKRYNLAAPITFNHIIDLKLFFEFYELLKKYDKLVRNFESCWLGCRPADYYRNFLSNGFRTYFCYWEKNIKSSSKIFLFKYNKLLRRKSKKSNGFASAALSSVWLYVYSYSQNQ
jgi:hypothetical protein